MNEFTSQKQFSTRETEAFLKLVRGYWYKYYLLYKLPAAWFSGVKLEKMDYDTTSISLKYSWFSQNPFRSTYFACLAMAAEMSTGLPCLMVIQGRKPGVSMLVIEMKSFFYKKATGRTTFVCNDNRDIFECIELARQTGESRNITATSVGYNERGEKVAAFEFNWSFRVKE